jgi:periplasmic protein TonB
MEINNILSSNLLDIIFDGRNKLYGAYELRTSYNRRLTKAVIFTVSFTLLAIIGAAFAGKVTDEPAAIEVKDYALARVIPEVPLPIIPPPVKPIVPEPNQVKFIKNIVIVKNLDVDEVIEDITDERLISSTTIVSENTRGIIEAPVAATGSTVIEEPVVKDDDKIFIDIQIQAQFPNGAAAWARYLQKNLNPSTPVNNNAPAGTYKVIVQFIVSKDGTLSDVRAETKEGYGLEEEAVKIIRNGPKWIPGMHNGRNVNSYRSQPIIFVVEE